LFIGCDGGLMHVANSWRIPSITLFAKVRPNMRLTKSTTFLAKYNWENVNNFSPQEITETINRGIILYCKDLRT